MAAIRVRGLASWPISVENLLRMGVHRKEPTEIYVNRSVLRGPIRTWREYALRDFGLTRRGAKIWPANRPDRQMLMP